MPSPAPKVCPSTGSGCEYNCIGTCGSSTVAVEPDPDPDVAYVAMSRAAIVSLLEQPSGPLVVMGLEPSGPGFELIVRRPNAFELHAALELVGKL